MPEPGSVGAETLGGLLAEARALLAAGGIDSASLEARLLVEHFSETTRTDAVRDPDMVIRPETAAAVRRAVERRLAGAPVHRILGWREFYGLPLRLSPETLEPRGDTEVLVDLALPFVRRIAASRGVCRMIDLGTGTGAIALALLHAEPLSQAIGVDISEDALATAAFNADMTGVSDRFEALRSDWFDRVEGKFDLIVSNPPYIPSADLPGLQREVRDHDPRRALDGGPDGLDAYRVIAGESHRYLDTHGWIAVEIGYDQKIAVTGLFEDAGYRLVGEADDLGGRHRALAFER